jgi:histidyl-tRNA synthetase
MIQAPKGTKDYLPEEMRKRRQVMEKIRQVFEKYGYSEVCTPAFENLELFDKKGGIGDDNIKDIYRFQDKAERWLALRFEVTASIGRVIANNPSIAKPLKWYYISNLWRYEATRKGRLREFWQAGIENIGKRDEIVDAEILAITHDALKAVGIENFVMRVSSRKIISKVADKFGISDKFAFYRAIDKKEKLELEDWINELEGHFKSRADLDEFIDIIETPWEKLGERLSGIADEEIAYLGKMLEYCRSFGVCEKSFKVDISMIRGLDYYTDFIFETQILGEEDLGSVAGGGRYDNMVELFGGQSTPATGMAIGIERIMEMLLEKIPEEKAIDALILPFSDEFFGRAAEISTFLRKEGVRCDIEIMRAKFGKKMAYASEIGAKFAIIIGQEEAEKGCYTLKNMVTGEQKSVSKEELVREIK